MVNGEDKELMFFGEATQMGKVHSLLGLSSPFPTSRTNPHSFIRKKGAH